MSFVERKDLWPVGPVGLAVVFEPAAELGMIPGQAVLLGTSGRIVAEAPAAGWSAAVWPGRR